MRYRVVQLTSAMQWINLAVDLDLPSAQAYLAQVAAVGKVLAIDEDWKSGGNPAAGAKKVTVCVR